MNPDTDTLLCGEVRGTATLYLAALQPRSERRVLPSASERFHREEVAFARAPVPPPTLQ